MSDELTLQEEMLLSEYPEGWAHLIERERNGEDFSARAQATGPGGSSAYDQMLELANEMFAAGKAKTKEQAFAKVCVDRPDLYRQCREESPEGQRMAARRAARAKCNVIWSGVVKAAEAKVTARLQPDIYAAIAAVWRESPELYKQYAAARPR